MKANEFVKKYGWGEAKKILIDAKQYKEVSMHLPNDAFNKPTVLKVDDLKRLVESWELVARYGTADEAKEYLPMLRMDSYDELKQAIADVESCQ